MVKNIRIGSTTVKLYNKEKPAEEPILIKNLKFNASDISNIYDGTNIKKLIAGSNWNLAGDGLSFITNDNIYRITIGAFNIDRQQGEVRISSASVLPLISEAAFVKSLKVQKDRFEIKVKNIIMRRADVQGFLDQGNLIAESVELSPDLRIFNDRTVPFDKSSKVGKYPQQQLVKMESPLYIKKLIIKNGYISYRERGALSKQIGNVFFKNLNATVSNITNIKEKIASNGFMLLDANTKFMGVSNINTNWKLPLSSGNSTWVVAGTSGPFDATKLSAITEPLGIASIRKGKIDDLRFNFEGNDLKATGKETLLYHDLKVTLLKGAADSTEELQKRGLLSFVANILVRDKNPSGNTTRVTKIDYQRDVTKSFFNLLWKSVFDGAKRTASGKNDF